MPSAQLLRLVPQLRALALVELQEVDDWIHDRLDELDPWVPPPRQGREVVERARVGKVSYQRELVRCGKPTCRCVKGKPHGPYWYSYQRVQGRMVSKYVGKKLPKGVKP